MTESGALAGQKSLVRLGVWSCGRAALARPKARSAHLWYLLYRQASLRVLARSSPLFETVTSGVATRDINADQARLFSELRRC